MLSFDDLQQITNAETWDALLGQLEGGSFDAKAKGYDLSLEAVKHELAKDVTSFANSSGGFILLGFATKKSAVHPADEVSALVPFPASAIDLDQYRKVVAAWVDPQIEGLAVEWKAKTRGDALGFGGITVPAQAEGNKPYIVTKTVLDGTRRDMFVAVSFRRGDISQPVSAKDVRQWLKDGRNYQTSTAAQLAEIRAVLDEMRAGTIPSVAPAKSVELAANRMTNILSATGLVNRPHLVLAAYPLTAVQLKTFLSSGRGTITHALENPPTLRDYGWNLQTLDHAKIVEGKYRELTNGDRKVIRLFRDGTLVFTAAADSDFLGFGESLEDFHKEPRLISLAVIEVVYHFCWLYEAVLRDIATPADGIVLRFSLGQMHPGNGKPLYLNPYPVNSRAYGRNEDRHAAPSNHVDQEIEFSTTDFRSAACAYQLVREIFLWFGIEPALIPYAEVVDGVPVLSKTKLLASG